MCNKCIHKPICSIYMATGGEIIRCRHNKSERRGRWIVHGRGLTHWAECSECNTMGSQNWKRCPVCEAVMEGGTENA